MTCRKSGTKDKPRSGSVTSSMSKNCAIRAELVAPCASRCTGSAAVRSRKFVLRHGQHRRGTERRQSHRRDSLRHGTWESAQDLGAAVRGRAITYAKKFGSTPGLLANKLVAEARPRGVPTAMWTRPPNVKLGVRTWPVTALRPSKLPRASVSDECDHNAC